MHGNFSITIFCVLFTLGLAPRFSYANPLSSFTLQRRESTANETIELAENLFGPDDYNVTESNERYIVLSSDGTKRVEFDIVSGGIWATDQSEMSNSEDPGPDLPSHDDAIAIADALLAKLKLLPKGGPVKVSKGRVSGTFLAHECEPADGSGVYQRNEYPLQISVNYDITLSVYYQEFPIVGGGGKFQVTLGRCGKLIAFQGLWRDIVGQKCYNMTSQAEANSQFLELIGDANGPVTFNASIAFWAEPFGKPQETMYPVYVFNATSQVDGGTIAHRPQALRTDAGTPPTPYHKRVRELPSYNNQSTDSKVWEAATEWLGEPYGLLMTQNNSNGFTTGILAATPEWTTKYDRSNQGAWVSDFTSEVNNYTNSVNMVFYTGHANKDGWMANESGNSEVAPQLVNYTSMENACHLLGRQNLSWLLIAACGPHQDESFDPNAGNVFDRWRGVFNGLHIMFAYGTPSYDTSAEGALFTKYAVDGYTLIDSWFRMAKEAQASGVIVTAMWTDGPGGNARNDHLPGYGSVSEDNIGSSQCRWFMWSEC